ncbi:hypothetical protein LUZ63_003601 [Rhynchospora breviuscula]|uniref:MADS-box transcription factor n=1 Tax=Rhynchospora breviuscula TaxID=2022672 RepID=A0A9Q0D225_9POAL|nr:hypothetical protein LUZ63_003601 [Rhynchospora breviuscula]
MGRGKIEIKRIENSSNRQVTFSKRKNGIIKKAREISVLCDCTVSIIIFSSSGKHFEFCSPSTTLPALLEKYQNNSGKKLWDAKHESLSAEIERIRKENDNMQIELRHLRGEDINSLQPQELIAIEASLETGVEAVRAARVTFLQYANCFTTIFLCLFVNFTIAILLYLANEHCRDCILLAVIMCGNL